MRELTTEIGIEAPAELVWAILADFGAYARWNPFIRAISGRARAGRTVDVTLLRQGGAAQRTSRQMVTSVTAPRELRWRGRWRIPGLFEREHRFRIDGKRGGGVRFRQIQSFRGLLGSALSGYRNADIAQDFALMNEALKARAEKAYAQSIAEQRKEAAR